MPAELLRKRSSLSSRRSGGAVPTAALRRDLIAWYRRAARDLPWRRTRDPWAIWVSEVMLQQTQVKTALPYYPRFLGLFPTPAALARASEPRVLAAWSGLGYYRRARQLRAAAQQVVREHGGFVPSDAEAFGRLPGVGRYTRAAVLSMGFGAKLAVLDGNVARVLARVFALPAAVRDPQGARALWALAESLVPARGAGEWNQALMELGAVVCTARAPRCGECPLNRHCRALALGRVAEFPPITPRRKSVRVRRAVALISCGGRLLMVRREGVLLDGLWEPPGVELSPRVDARKALEAELRRLGVRARVTPTGEIVRHTITHRAIEVEVWRGQVEPGETSGGARTLRARYIDARPGKAPLSALAARLARRPRVSTN
jgi:A/G-specific adenine glycosylase